MADRPDLVLWSRNRAEEIEGVCSHQSALSLYELSDLNPSKIHIAVPTDFRRTSDIIRSSHFTMPTLPGSDVQAAQGFKFTRPLEIPTGNPLAFLRAFQ